jgi:uncharacterized protein YajQ (UPF0234 family)
MPSFDVVNKIDLQDIDNAINNAKKEIRTRYDFRNSKTEMDLDKKTKKIHVVTEDTMKLKAIRDTLVTHFVRTGIDPKVLDFAEEEPTSGGMIKCDASLREGIDQDLAKKMVKMIKDTKLKVQAAIQGDQLRITGKKIDDLQEVIQLLKSADLDVPMQFVNMKS